VITLYRGRRAGSLIEKAKETKREGKGDKEKGEVPSLSDDGVQKVQIQASSIETPESIMTIGRLEICR
jgi:hypothetical protein